MGMPWLANRWSYSVTMFPSKSLWCRSREMFLSCQPAFENSSMEYSKKCMLSVFWWTSAPGARSSL